MLTAHEFRPTSYAPAAYVVHEWKCTCGAQCRRRTRSRLLAELDWYADHVLPAAVPEKHVPTLAPGGFENAVMWTCGCGVHGNPHGHVDERRAWQSHKAHANAATTQWYREEWARLVQGQPAAEWADYRDRLLRQRWQAEDAERHRPLHPAIVKELLDGII